MDNNGLILTEQNDLNIHKHINHTDINNNNNNTKQQQQQQPHYITKTQTNTTPSLHIHKPVPKSKLQKAEDKYFSLKAEIHSNIFSSSSSTPPSNIQMLSYLEKLNTVLSEIITNTKLTNKQNARLRRAQQDPVPTMIDQDQLNDNNQKLIIVYKKQYSLLKAKLARITKENFLLNLEQERKVIDNELNALHAETKKLQNEQKLNDITLSKITKGTNKSEIELKRLVMDYDALKRQKTSIVNKLNNKKQLYEDNDMKITQLNEFHERLESIAKDMYHITEYGNVKDKEMNVQKKEKYRKNLIYKINILDKAIMSNQKRFVSESKQNIKKIMELRIQKEMMIEKYVNDGGKYEEEEDNEDVLKMEREYNEEEREEKDKEEVKREEKEAVLKEIEKLFMERDKERNEGEKYVNKINEDNVSNKECVEDKKVLVENKEENKDKDDNENEHEECNKDNSGVEDMLVTHNDKKAENDNKEIENNVPEFLEGFVDNKSNVIQSDNLDVVENNNNKNDLQISHEAVKARKQKIEIIQKEYKEINSTNNNNNENTHHLPKQSTNEYEELEEFQI